MRLQSLQNRFKIFRECAQVGLQLGYNWVWENTHLDDFLNLKLHGIQILMSSPSSAAVLIDLLLMLRIEPRGEALCLLRGVRGTAFAASGAAGKSLPWSEAQVAGPGHDERAEPQY